MEGGAREAENIRFFFNFRTFIVAASFRGRDRQTWGRFHRHFMQTVLFEACQMKTWLTQQH
jgi:hypothetical protein